MKTIKEQGGSLASMLFVLACGGFSDHKFILSGGWDMDTLVGVFHSRIMGDLVWGPA